MKNLLFSITLLLCSICVNAQTAQEWRDSILVLQQKIEQQPKDLELKMRKAEANIALEQWQYAMDEYDAVLKLYPTHLGALYFRAFTNYKFRRYPFARADYESVLKYAPTHIGAMQGLIQTNIAEGKMQKAQDVADYLAGLFPDSAVVYVCRADVEEARGMTDLAIDDYSKAIKIEESKLDATKPLTADDDYTIDIISRMELYRKKGDDASLERMYQDKQLLINRGIPAGLLIEFKR